MGIGGQTFRNIGKRLTVTNNDVIGKPTLQLRDLLRLNAQLGHKSSVCQLQALKTLYTSCTYR